MRRWISFRRRQAYRAAAHWRASRSARWQGSAALWLPALLVACGEGPSGSGTGNQAAAGDVRASHRLASDWPAFGGDPAGTRFSLLSQINTRNVGNLTRVWTYPLGTHASSGELWGGSQVTPLVVDGTLFVPAANWIVALAPETGNELWRHRVAGVPSRRGLAYWDGGGDVQARVFFTTDTRLIALNARTGRRIETFGAGGEVSIPGQDGVNAVPQVYGDRVIVGAGSGPTRLRALDAVTGEERWRFHAPSPGTAGASSPGSFAMSLDVDRGLLYATFSDYPDYPEYSEHDEHSLTGAATAAEGHAATHDLQPVQAVVALDVHTGRPRWHFSTLRGDAWGYEAPAPPVLLDVPVDGHERALLALATPTGYLYLLDRVTGAPVFGVEALPVPAAPDGPEGVPDQVVPLLPPPLARVRYDPEDIVAAADTHAAHASFCQDLHARSGGLWNDGPFTPFLHRQPDVEPRSTLLFPGTSGAVGWGGAAADPTLGYVFVNTMDLGSLGWMEPGSEGAAVYRRNSAVGGPRARFWWSGGAPQSDGNAFGAESAWPCQKPPWGHLSAVDVATGEIVWRVPLGVTSELPGERRRTGRPNAGGPLATAGGLVFIGASNDRRFRAFDALSGEELWVTELDMSAHAVPVSYQGRDGRQYIAVTAGGAGSINPPDPPHPQALVVYALP